jgi:PAS domain S-box-containing protein
MVRPKRNSRENQTLLRRQRASMEKRQEKGTNINRQFRGQVFQQKQVEGGFRGGDAGYCPGVENLDALICRFLPDGTLTFVNEAFCGHFGRTVEDLIGTSMLRLSPEVDGKAVAKGLATIGPANPVGTWLTRDIGPDGKKRWQRWTIIAISNDNGNALEFQGVGREITECMEMVEALSEIKSRHRTIVESVQEIIWTVDLDFVCTYVNPSVASVLGYAPEEIVSLNLLDTFSPSSRDRLVEVVKQAMTEDPQGVPEATLALTEQVEQYHKDGHLVALETTLSFLRNEAGQVVEILGISRDVTEHRKIEQMKAGFVNTAAHAIRHPLTSIRGYSELLLTRDDIPPDDQTVFLRCIKDQAETLAETVDDLLAISRIESGTLFPCRESTCNITAIITGLVSFYEYKSEVHEFSTVLPQDTIEVMADKSAMEKLFSNLLDNAVTYSPNGGLIRVTARRGEDHFVFSISDQGVGMSPDQMRRVFESFYRADTSNTGIPGTGLGMTIAKGIVESQGGKLSIESTKGEGTTVNFTLPVANPVEGESR